MQTFLPFPDFYKSLNCLDELRLRNQVVRECKTLINGGWANHPVAIMWERHKPSLAEYAIIGLNILESKRWLRSDAVERHFEFFYTFIPQQYRPLPINNPKRQAHSPRTICPPPRRIGDPEFHLSHRLNLLWKDPAHYSNYFDEPVPTIQPRYKWWVRNPNFKPELYEL